MYYNMENRFYIVYFIEFCPVLRELDTFVISKLISMNNKSLKNI